MREASPRQCDLIVQDGQSPRLDRLGAHVKA
jgi:hypothetical protein